LNSEKNKHKVLVIDDDLSICRILNKSLGEYYKFIGAINEHLAIETLNTHNIKAILCDIGLKEENGLLVAQRIKGYVKFEKIPLIILSGQQSDNYKIQAFRMGCEDYICKPLNYQTIHSRIQSQFNKKNKSIQANWGSSRWHL
jgi:PleD family two-component response regulator